MHVVLDRKACAGTEWFECVILTPLHFVVGITTRRDGGTKSIEIQLGEQVVSRRCGPTDRGAVLVLFEGAKRMAGHATIGSSFYDAAVFGQHPFICRIIINAWEPSSLITLGPVDPINYPDENKKLVVLR